MLLKWARISAAPRVSRSLNWFSFNAAPTRKWPRNVSFKVAAFCALKSPAPQGMRTASKRIAASAVGFEIEFFFMASGILWFRCRQPSAFRQLLGHLECDSLVELVHSEHCGADSKQQSDNDSAREAVAHNGTRRCRQLRIVIKKALHHPKERG